jgi:hypothetical protein
MFVLHNYILQTFQHNNAGCPVACHSSMKIFAIENALREAYKYELGICIPLEEYGIRDYIKT